MEDNVKVVMGDMPASWKNGAAKTITFCVTEDCNLACKYCYMTGKNKKKKMSFEVAKKAVDYILDNREDFSEEAVIWEFIGGEPFLEIDLIEKISDYIKQRMYILDHPWFEQYRFNFSSNGLLYGTPKVQAYIKKNIGHLSIGISIDGNKLKHDRQRVRLDGTGSYDDIMKIVPLWQKQFPMHSTKATFSHDDIPNLKESIISLWDIGIKMVAANVVFEDVWQEGDDLIFEQQLMELGDYILDNELWKDFSVRFFQPSIGFPVNKDNLEKNYCGSGKMLAIDCEGNFHPCVRFYDFSLSNRKSPTVGNIYTGLNRDRLRAFDVLSTRLQSKKECLDCNIAKGCSWCTGFNYDVADTPTIFQRMTFNCNMHKANVRANKYFWDKFEKVTGLPSRRREYETLNNQKYLLLITSDKMTPHCYYTGVKGEDSIMSKDTFSRGLEFARENGFVPILLGHPEHLSSEDIAEYTLIDGNIKNEAREKHIKIVLCGSCEPEDITETCILMVKRENIDLLSASVEKLAGSCSRINVMLQDMEQWNGHDLEKYGAQLEQLIPLLYKYKSGGKMLQVNVLSDILDNKSMCNCEAGRSTFSLAPNGKIYICPAFYFNDPDDFIGTLESGIEVKNEHLMTLEYAPICSECDANHCKRCKFLNLKFTGEIHIPSRIQCLVSHLEREKSAKYQRMLLESNIFTENHLKEIDYNDPLEKIKKRRKAVND